MFFLVTTQSPLPQNPLSCAMRLVQISLLSVLSMLCHYTKRGEWICMGNPSLISLRSGILDFGKLWCNRSCCWNTREVLCAIIQYSKYVNMQWWRRLMGSKYITRELTECVSRGYFRDKQDKTVILSNSHIILLHGTTL